MRLAQDVVEALEVEGVGTATPVDARGDAEGGDDLGEAVGELLPRHRDLEVEVPARVGDEAARHERATDKGGTCFSRLKEPLGHAERYPVAGNEYAKARKVSCQALLLGHLDEVVSRLMENRAPHGK